MASALLPLTSIATRLAPPPPRHHPLALRPSQARTVALKLPPLSLSLDPASVDVVELSALLASTGQNCFQFPEILNDGTVLQPANPSKLRLALENSTVVVSMHLRGDIPGSDYMHRGVEDEPEDDGKWNPFLPHRSSKKRLVAFGRATSDHSLTASIYDVAVAPSLQRLGLGRQVLQRIIRDLTRRGICDIAVLTSPEQSWYRPFFRACGFSPDALGSTTMLYTRSTLLSSVKKYGKKRLLVPRPLKDACPLNIDQESSTVQIEALK